MKIDRPPVPERELSLIERAEALWGFGDGLKPVAGAVEAGEPETASLGAGLVKRKAAAVAAEPAASLLAEKKSSTSTSSVRTDAGDGLAFLATEPFKPVPSVTPALSRGPASSDVEQGSGIPGQARDDEEGRRDNEKEVEPLDLAQPFDLTQPLPEWAAPTGVAAIDRVMLAQKGMLVPGAPIGALAEEFRLIKRQLLLTARQVAEGPLGQRARTILVGSGKPGDGKTYSAINLAISLAAERDVEILLVDADFAKPDVMKTLGLEDSVGFLDILGDPSLDPETCIVRTDVPQLSLLPSGQGTTMDTELLASKLTEEVIDRLLAANPKRMIVFDTPPTLAASPASVLALLVGQVMLVVRADRTTEADVREAVSLLDGCDHISLVLNAVSYQPGGGRFGSYYGQEKSR